MLEPRDKGIVLWTLRYGDEVRDPTAYFAGDRASKPDSDLLKLVTRLIDEKQKRWTSAMVRDPVQERLLDIIASKKAPRPIVLNTSIDLSPSAGAEEQQGVVRTATALIKCVAEACGGQLLALISGDWNNERESVVSFSLSFFFHPFPSFSFVVFFGIFRAPPIAAVVGNDTLLVDCEAEWSGLDDFFLRVESKAQHRPFLLPSFSSPLLSSFLLSSPLLGLGREKKIAQKKRRGG